MTNGVTFNVYAQDPSPNAYVHAATATNSTGGYTRLDHPLLDGIPCARVQVTRKFGVQADSSFDVTYFDGAWQIYHQDEAPITGSQFYVLVDPRQVFECTDSIFANGLEP